jgi:hypothetical protein
MRTKRLLWAILGTVTLGIALMAPSPAFAASQGPYLIANWGAYPHCIDDPNGNTANNVRMIIYTCGSPRQANQQWDFIDTDGGYYNIKNRASHKCLTVLNNSTANNAPIIQYTCNTGDNEEWTPYYDTYIGNVDYYILLNRHSQYCLTIGGNIASGTPLVQSGCVWSTGFGTWTWGA